MNGLRDRTMINQLTVIDEYTRHKYMQLAMVATVNWLINFYGKRSRGGHMNDIVFHY